MSIAIDAPDVRFLHLRVERAGATASPREARSFVFESRKSQITCQTPQFSCADGLRSVTGTESERFSMAPAVVHFGSDVND